MLLPVNGAVVQRHVFVEDDPLADFNGYRLLHARNARRADIFESGERLAQSAAAQDHAIVDFGAHSEALRLVIGMSHGQGWARVSPPDCV
ncbi:hypothetical protein D3C84_838620 [compost metagenome]